MTRQDPYETELAMIRPTTAALAGSRTIAIDTRTARILWLLMGGVALTALLVARWLTPDASGIGTHTQLGLPPCGFLVLTSLPCPACGLTTSFAHMARLQLTSAFSAHPLGVLLYGLTALGALLSVAGLLRGWPPSLVFERLQGARVAVVLAVLALLVWVARIGLVFA